MQFEDGPVTPTGPFFAVALASLVLIRVVSWILLQVDVIADPPNHTNSLESNAN
jgi:hypothetical protein